MSTLHLLGQHEGYTPKRRTTDSIASMYHDVADMHALAPKLLRVRGFSSRTRERRNQGPQMAAHGVFFSPSETRIIDAAREDILYRRRHSREDWGRLGTIFGCIFAFTFVFPLIGLLALIGVFDTTISWYTRGGKHSLTDGQRSVLKKQLAIEGLAYGILVIILAVHFSVGL